MLRAGAVRSRSVAGRTYCVPPHGVVPLVCAPSCVRARCQRMAYSCWLVAGRIYCVLPHGAVPLLCASSCVQARCHRVACTCLMNRAVARSMSRYAVGSWNSRCCMCSGGDPNRRRMSRRREATSSRVSPHLASTASSCCKSSDLAFACAGQSSRTWPVSSIGARSLAFSWCLQCMDTHPRSGNGKCGWSRLLLL